MFYCITKGLIILSIGPLKQKHLNYELNQCGFDYTALTFLCCGGVPVSVPVS